MKFLKTGTLPFTFCIESKLHAQSSFVKRNEQNLALWHVSPFTLVILVGTTKSGFLETILKVLQNERRAQKQRKTNKTLECQLMKGLVWITSRGKNYLQNEHAEKPDNYVQIQSIPKKVYMFFE